MAVAVGDIVQINNEFEFQGDANVYSWFLQAQEINDPDELETDIRTFGQEREDAWLPLQDPNLVFRCVSGRVIFPTKSLQYVTTTGQAGTYTAVGGPLPGQCSMVVTLYGDTDDPNRHNRGRDFLTGMDCADQANGVWDLTIAMKASLVSLMYSAMSSTYVDAQSGNVYRIGLFSPTQAKKTIPVGDPPVAPDPDAVYFWPLEKIRIRSLVRTQRRRASQDPCEAVIDRDILVT